MYIETYTENDTFFSLIQHEIDAASKNQKEKKKKGGKLKKRNERKKKGMNLLFLILF